ncbi:hypothetical protein [Brachybacterium vulturis]|uniref:hypothetical protein n=1 Tax=Brachybacterium vulturis TaxID=2017484 RepID=UPI00373545DA
MTKSIREGEQYGMDISDRLGIESEHARNLVKTHGGFSSAMDAAYRDPKDDSRWCIGKDLPPFG